MMSQKTKDKCVISPLPPSSGVLLLSGVLPCLPGGDLQASSGTLEEGGLDDNSAWDEERELERLACEGDDFVPPKIMVPP